MQAKDDMNAPVGAILPLRGNEYPAASRVAAAEMSYIFPSARRSADRSTLSPFRASVLALLFKQKRIRT